VVISAFLDHVGVGELIADHKVAVHANVT